MKTIVMNIPTKLSEIGTVVQKNWKKIVVPTALTVGGIAATVLTKGKIWGKDDSTGETNDVPEIPAAEEETNDIFGSEPEKENAVGETGEETEGR